MLRITELLFQVQHIVVNAPSIGGMAQANFQRFLDGQLIRLFKRTAQCDSMHAKRVGVAVLIE